MKKVTKSEFFDYIGKGDYISSQESFNDCYATVLVDRRTNRKVGKISAVLNEFGTRQYPSENEYYLF